MKKEYNFPLTGRFISTRVSTIMTPRTQIQVHEFASDLMCLIIDRLFHGLFMFDLSIFPFRGYATYLDAYKGGSNSGELQQ